MSEPIRVSTDVKKSYIQGRNGTYDIKEVLVTPWSDTGTVKIDGIGKSGTCIRGGLEFTVLAMDEICSQWSKARGLMPEVYETITNEVA